MSIFEKERFEIWNQTQHPYKHGTQDFSYTHSAVPFVSTLQGALNALFSNLYPNTKESVATPASLPTGVDTPNIGDVTPTNLDYRVVLDDGDGKAAGYRWEQREGELSASWHKIYDMDWGESSILANFLTKTNDTYVSKFGQDETDSAGNVIVGLLSGQYIYGGSSANTNLTLYANSGDGTGVNTGYIQLGDNFRPIADATFDLGTITERLKNGYFSTSLNVGTLSITGSVITSTTGILDFDNENLTTLGSMEMAEAFINGAATLKHITTPTDPAATFSKLYVKSDGKLYIKTLAVEKVVGLDFTSTNDNRLIKSNGLTGTAIQESGIVVSDLDEISGVTKLTVDFLTFDGQTISTPDLNRDIHLAPNGSGKVIVPAIQFTASTQNAVYTPSAAGILTARGVLINPSDEISGVTKFTVDNLVMDLNTISNSLLNTDMIFSVLGTGTFKFNAGILPDADSSKNIGSTALRWNNINISGSLSDGTNTISIATLLSLSEVLTGAVTGDALFYNAVSGKFEASAPDSEIDHGSLLATSLLDDDHTQYALLAGRIGGQSLIGGTDASNSLVLESTSNAIKGSILVKDNVSPFTTASFSGGWQGTDLGSPANIFRNIYLAGEAKGLRLENFTVATLPASSANNKGRQAFATDSGKVYTDTGAGWVAVGGTNKYQADLAFNGIEVLKNVDVSSTITDARTAIIQLLDNNNNFERIYCSIKATTAANVQISTGVALPVGSYRLIVME